MKRKHLTAYIVFLLSIAIVASGCQTYGESGAAGAAAGAGTGAIIGHQSGHQGEGAVIGAVLGGLLGLIVHSERTRKTRDAATTAQAYPVDSQEGEHLQFEDAQVYPSSVKRGNLAEATIQYALLGVPTLGVDVAESRTLKSGDQVLAELSTHHFTRTNGTWVSTLPFRIPQSIEPGEYTIVQSVQTAQSRISSNTRFIVSSE